MYFIYNLGKSVIVERFIRTLKGKIYRQIATNIKVFLAKPTQEAF